MQKTPFYPDALYFDTRVRSYLEHKLARTLPEPGSPEFEDFVETLQTDEPELFGEVMQVLRGSSARRAAYHPAYLTRLKELSARFLQLAGETLKAKRRLLSYLFGSLCFLIPVLYLISQALYLDEPSYATTALLRDEVTPVSKVETLIPEPRVLVQVSQVVPPESATLPTPQVSAQLVQTGLAEPISTAADSLPTKTVADNPASSSPAPVPVEEIVSETPTAAGASSLETANATPPAPVSSEPAVSAVAPVEQASPPTPADVSARPTTLALHTVENAPPTTLNIAQGERSQSLTLIGRSASP